MSSSLRLLVLASVACLAGACGTDDGPALPADVAAAGDAEPPAHADSAAEVGSEGDGAESAAEAVSRDEACGEYDDGTYGEKVPWTGFEHAGKTYTCNTCRGGTAALQGTWRLLDFATEDPEVPLANGWLQTFTFDGNVWSQRATWQADGVALEATMEGWYWCGSKPELDNEARVFIVTELTPPDALGYEAGYVFTADLLMSTEGGDRFAFLFYDGFNTGDQLAEVYCRVGSDVTTLAGETKPCEGPFE